LSGYQMIRGVKRSLLYFGRFVLSLTESKIRVVEAESGLSKEWSAQAAYALALADVQRRDE